MQINLPTLLVNFGMNDPFIEFALILIIAAVIGAIGRMFKQPLIVSFIAVGILVGPSGLAIIHSYEQIHLLAEVGIALLLFVVGLKLDVSLIKSTGKIALLTGLGQVVFTSLFGYLIGLALGFDHVTSMYIAIALTFSSTIIIVKLLTDKKEIDSLHGQIAIGFLIVQDIVVVILMILLSTTGTETAEGVMVNMLLVFLKGIGMIVFLALMMKYVLPGLLKQLAFSQELLVLFSVAWAVALAAAGDMLSFSKEVGAFLAGVSLASTHFREVISGRLVSLRDFLLLFFFISLGSQLDLSLLGAQLVPALVFSLFVLVGNPLIVLIIMGLMRYTKRTAFLAGLTVAQISEFSLILATLGFNQGHIDAETLGLITLVGLITIGLSTYMILYSHKLYRFLSPVLSIFESRKGIVEKAISSEGEPDTDIIIFGLGRYGNNIAGSLEKENCNILGVDFDPQIVEQWKIAGRKAIYGDVEDPEMTELLPLEQAKFVVSTFPDRFLNESLLKHLKMNEYKGKVILTSHSSDEVPALEKLGADLVLLPFADAAEKIYVRMRKMRGGDVN